eukprot:TRINITY_DN112209_c0_g1_i1.p2 TRINITY_DN112209_c0_g1~~TRINITY_DN112209_c0_g1_i1.p2  ORF type:complete len:164 (+),score=36.90 TRINITY_DN112209_c0_g1_i1:161-652(+)
MAPAASVRRLSKASSDPKTPLKGKRNNAAMGSPAAKYQRLPRKTQAEGPATEKSNFEEITQEAQPLSMEQYRRKVVGAVKFCNLTPGKWLSINMTTEAFHEIIAPFSVGLLPAEFDSTTSLVIGSVAGEDQLHSVCAEEASQTKMLTFTFMPKDGKLSLHASR